MNSIKTTSLALLIASFSISAIANEVNLNKASKDELLKGIIGLTEKQANAIIEYREKEGVFMKVPELLHIGIGPDIIGPNYNNLSVGGAGAGDKKPSRLN
jgi:competence ComEA-like helix-hairpin-helix protein